MFTRIKILTILLFFIQSRVALGVNIHYCENLVANFSYLHSVEGCDMHDSKFDDNYQISQEACCQDMALIFDKNQIETESKTTSLFDTTISQSFFEYIFIVDDYIITKIPEFPPPKIPAFKKYCSLVFYG